MFRIRCNLFYTILNCDDTVILLFQHILYLPELSSSDKVLCALVPVLFLIELQIGYMLDDFLSLFELKRIFNMLRNFL